LYIWLSMHMSRSILLYRTPYKNLEESQQINS
jgi:hypothetical protein